MTAIIFHQGKLYGDRKQVTFTNPITYIDGEKIIVSKDKSFAYGVSGKAITAVQRDKYEVLIRKVLETMIIHGGDRTKLSQIVGQVDSDIDFTNGIICTKDVQYAIKDAAHVFAVRLDGRTHACGTGGSMLASLMRCGLTPTEAYKRLPQLDYLSGSVFDVIDTARLKQFVIKGGV
jgi:hypothetical protein